MFTFVNYLKKFTKYIIHTYIKISINIFSVFLICNLHPNFEKHNFLLIISYIKLIAVVKQEFYKQNANIQNNLFSKCLKLL